MNGFLIQWKARKTELLEYMGMTFAAFLAGFIAAWVLINPRVENNSATAGTMFAAIGLLFIHVLVSIFSFMDQFNVAVSMGATRKNFVTSYVLFHVIEIFVLEIELLVLGNLEKFLLEKLVPGVVLQLDITKFFDWKILLAMIVQLTVVELFCSAVVLRFGIKILLVFWAVFMLACFIPANFAANERFGKWFTKMGLLIGGKITTAGIVAGAALLLLGLAVISWNFLRKQRVTV